MPTIPFIGFADPISSWAHLLGAAFFLVKSFSLISKTRGNSLRVTAMSIYCFSIVFLLSMSGVFHLLPHESTGRAVLQRLDHAGIWFLIIGTFTPIHIILFKGFWRWGALACIWTMGITGLVLEVVFFNSIPEWLVLTFYLVLGWMGLFTKTVYWKIYRQRNIFWIVLGGLLYSTGAVLDFIRWPILIPGYLQGHELFHFFVLGGIYAHWHFISDICQQGISSKLTIRIKKRKRGPHFAVATTENIRFTFSDYDEFRIKLQERIMTIYHNYQRPKVIRTQTTEEEYITPLVNSAIRPSADYFHSSS